MTEGEWEERGAEAIVLCRLARGVRRRQETAGCIFSMNNSKNKAQKSGLPQSLRCSSRL